MSRWWTEWVGALGEVFPLGWAAAILIAAGILTGLLWYTFPAWVPRRVPRFLRAAFWRKRWLPRLPRLRLPRLRLPRLRLPRLRRRKRATITEAQIDELLAAEEELPAVPAEVYETLADRLARDGRYAEAIRERLRAAVRTLVVHGVIDNRPGWTVSELAGAAAGARPAIERPLLAASGLFSEIWYAERPATVDHDQLMRTYAAEVHANLAGGGGR